MKTLSRLLICTSFLVASLSAHGASFILTYAIGELPGLIAGTSTAVLVVDSGAAGFAGINGGAPAADTSDIASFGAIGSTGGGDMVILTATAADFGGPIGFDFGTTNFDTTNAAFNGLLTTNQAFGVYYFPSGSNAVGQSFGFYRSDSIEDGDRAYFTPLDGNTSNVITTTASLGGGTTISPVTGTIGAIPEPSRAILAGLGLMGLFFRRRR